MTWWPLLFCLFISAGHASPFDALHAAGIDPTPGHRIPLDRRFRDSHGELVSLRSLSDGQSFLLVPVLHRCPNLCGVTLAGIGAAVMGLPAARRVHLPVIAFGIDPRETSSDARATVESLRDRYPDLHTVVALTGASGDVAAVTGGLGYRYAWDDRIGQYDHIAATAVLTPDGKVARWLYGLAPATAQLSDALDAADRGETESIGQQLLLLCYHYDPLTGRYAPYVPGMLRVGAGATVLLLGGFIAMALLRDRSK